MLNFPRLFVASLCTLLSATLAFPATSPEDFVKDKKATPATAPAPAASAPATPAPATQPAPKAAPAAKPADKTAAKTAKSGAAGSAAAPMDTTKIHDQYLEGDFDQAIRGLEAHLKVARTMSHAESVFVYKHLGVMYAAQQSTRDKGKHYMHQLIAIEPTAKILDMYASDMIHLIFRNVQEEFEVKRVRLAPQPDTLAAAPAPDPQPAPVAETPKSAGSNKTLFMAAAGAAVAVGGLTLFLVLSDEEPKTRTIKVTE